MVGLAGGAKSSMCFVCS